MLKKQIEIVRKLRVKAAGFTPDINGNCRGKPAGARKNGIKTCQKSCTKVRRVAQKSTKKQQKNRKKDDKCIKKIA